MCKVRVGILALGLFLASTAPAEAANQCQEIFKTGSFDNGADSSGKSKRDLKARFTVDAKTKQNRMESFVEIANNRELWVDYLQPAPGKPIIVLLNGLTYRVGLWDRFVRELKGEGLGILRYDPIGMGETMKKYGPPTRAVTITEQVADLNRLLIALGITQKVHVLGLSYGGGMAIEFAATFPHKIATVIPEAAYTGPLKGQVDQIKTQIALTRAAFPFNPATDRQLYSYFLRQSVFTTYWISERVALEHPYKLESIFQLADGATDFRASDFVNQLPKGTLHQIDAGKDQYITPDVPQAFWDSLPLDVRASRMILDHSEHKIPEAMPSISAEWVKLIINGDKRLQNGNTWRGGVYEGGFIADGEKIEIK